MAGQLGPSLGHYEVFDAFEVVERRDELPR